jgi:hypothetical protein
MIVILGRDGYRAVLALGEIAPEFGAKQVILAERMASRSMPIISVSSSGLISEAVEASGT